ncbi:MAG: hypothetical protein IKS48_11480 [Eubacterium sp.]|nr:hypothetical protein [Clostridiales bacterium]MBR6403995.1 hypothetical protein [Eubacterium sp.]
MNINNLSIVPFKGIGEIGFNLSYDETKDLLKRYGIKYTVDVWDNKGCDPEVPWSIIRIGKDISLFFAKGKMFKILLEDDYTGSLENGICIGTSITKALELDSSLIYEDSEEYYSSSLGYWLEDDPDSQKVISITVFIKELLDEDTFFDYKW